MLELKNHSTGSNRVMAIVTWRTVKQVKQMESGGIDGCPTKVLTICKLYKQLAGSF